ncbi:MAG TPA: prenyltransferase/squalene oxidase repeat-containing protein [Gemmataceae bacterium]|nr:prenyltransferase/squalene oxidase repeat-containing protein [Gemmataceae bacterium]
MRSSVCAFLAVLMLVPASVCTGADEAKKAAARVQMDEATKKATARALEWIARKQDKDGSWSDGPHQHNTAITAFALLAFMSQGHLPDQGLYGPEVARGCRFLLASAREDGYLTGARGGSMYCHAMATLALGELWGMTGDDKIKPVLKKAVNLIVRCQNREGGWRYNPDKNSDADISVTIMQVMALRAAKNSGLFVPDKTLRHAIAYINKCYNEQSGGFSYQPYQVPGFARTAAGVCVLQLSGKYDAKEIKKAVGFLKQNFLASQHFWYGHYYAAHAMHQVGGDEWKAWYSRINKDLMDHQTADGSWSTHHNEVGPVFHTSIAVIILSVPANYLPIFQR